MKMSLIICLLLLILGKQGQSLSYCEESSCGAGPPIRFPFRLKDRQPKDCGYGGFDLSCTERNDTLLELPNSVISYVKTIDYVNQVINVYCSQRQVRNISCSASPFRFNEENLRDISLFNCTKSDERDYRYNRVPCLGFPGYEVYAFFKDEWINYRGWLISCTKMYNLLSFPFALLLSPQNNNLLQMTWLEPACGNCEAQGGRCELKVGSSKGETNCININKTRTGTSIKVITIGVTSCLLVVLLLFASVFILYISNRKEKQKQARIEKFLEDYEALTPTRYSYADLKRITDQFKDTLGEGAYGTVFKGKLSNEILVAVKILNNSTGNGEEFINEVATMGSIHHVNVVRLVGFCAEGFRRAMVYEFLPNKSLEKFIFSNDGNNRNSLGWQKIQDIALGIAKGFEYLHQGCDQRILHFDIKPHNILLDQNFTPKISDFGLAKLCSKDQSVISMTTVRGTVGYIAPEVFSRNFGNVSYKSDVYSFGILLLEMVGGKTNTNTNADQMNQVFFQEWIYDHLDRGEELRIRIVEEGDTKIVRKLAIVGLWCIQWSPVERPSMTSVVQMLEGEGNDLAVPPNPFASTALRSMDSTMQSQTPIHQHLATISETE